MNAGVYARTFTLGPSVTDEQLSFLDEHGFLVFKGFLSREEVDAMTTAIDDLADAWVSENRRWVNGIPLFYGRDEGGNPYIQRLAFVSQHCATVREILNDGRFEPVRDLISSRARIGELEKDGVVVNRYLNVDGSVHPRLGWHTDGLRDLFYLRKPKKMLNVGLHFDRVRAEDGGLRLIPGSHKQGFRSMATRKVYFLDHRPDPEEIAIETDPGDLTVHDGRLWHRVQQNTKRGRASLRRTMFVPFLTDEPQPKHEHSPTPLYHYLGQALRASQQALGRARDILA